MKTLIFLLMLTVLMTAAFSQDLKLTQERRYEPVVLPAYSGSLQAVVGAPVNELFLYAYDQGTQNWRMMPFQIDEQSYGPDPLKPSVKKWMYFVPDFWSADTINIPNHNGVFDDHDELVFMVRDLGDQAPERSFIDNAEAKAHSKIELVVTNPENPNDKAYAYIFQSSTITEPVPTPYNIQYLAAEDSVLTAYYSLGLDENGTVDGICIKEPGGNGADILDLLKIRFGGVIDLAFPVSMVADERLLYLFNEIQVTAKPVVRLIREAQMTLRFGEFVADYAAFPVQAKFYPFSGTIKGGTSLAPEDLKFTYPDAEILIILNNLRESWDFSAAATGMRFYNKYNNGILIDGNPDEVNPTIDLPISNWDLTTGDQGSLFKVAKFTEQKWGNVELYFFDSSAGGQADEEVFVGSSDTGDSLSYGDNGILFRNKPGQDSVTIELNYTVYFMPEKNLTQADGEKMAQIVSNPVQTSSTLIVGVPKQDAGRAFTFELAQNYPNPFNQSTRISFSLPQKEDVVLQVFDANGRLVKNLVNHSCDAGSHEVYWDGTDDQAKPVASGIFFYKLRTSRFELSRKLVLVR